MQVNTVVKILDWFYVHRVFFKFRGKPIKATLITDECWLEGFTYTKYEITKNSVTITQSVTGEYRSEKNTAVVDIDDSYLNELADVFRHKFKRTDSVFDVEDASDESVVITNALKIKYHYSGMPWDLNSVPGYREFKNRLYELIPQYMEDINDEIMKESR